MPYDQMTSSPGTPIAALGIGDLNLRAAGDGDTAILTSVRKGRRWDERWGGGEKHRGKPGVEPGKPVVYPGKTMVST